MTHTRKIIQTRNNPWLVLEFVLGILLGITEKLVRSYFSAVECSRHKSLENYDNCGKLYGTLLFKSYVDFFVIAFITFNSSSVRLIQGLCSSNPSEFEFSVFRRNRTDDLGINSPLLWPTEPRLHVKSHFSIYNQKRYQTSLLSPF